VSTALVPDKILRDLSKMWASLAHSEGGAPSGGVLRACSLTLVVLAAPGEDPVALSEILAALMPMHPAQAIVVRLGGSDTPAAEVTARCWMSFGQRRQVCSEEVEITAPENGLDDVVTALSPIVAPDLPVILWCRGEQAMEAASFGRLASLATRVVVDASQWPDAKPAIQRVYDLARHAHVGDLAWTRLTPWREMISEVFENTNYAGRASEIVRIHVVCAGKAPVEAYYMAAWLSDSLTQAGAHFELQMEADETGGMRQLQQVELFAGAFTVKLMRLRDTLAIEMDGVSRCINLPQSRDDLLMSEELDILRADPVFERTLQAAARLRIE